MKKINHGNRDHALLSASGSSRWIVCTPSPRLEEFEKESSSSYAQEGTLAHEFADIFLQLSFGKITKRKYNSELAKLKKNKLYTGKEMDIEVSKYTDFVIEEYNVALQNDSDSLVETEEKLSLSSAIPDSFGTVDNVIVSNGVLHIIDLKYGKGVKVNASQGNSQLRLYAKGALDKYEMSFDISVVKMTIMQPRLDHINSEIMDVGDLQFWIDYIVTPAAKLAYSGEGDVVAGDHCRWCKIKYKCKALQEEALSAAKIEFKETPELLSDNELIDAFSKLRLYNLWSKALAEHILQEAKDGKKWPGYKLVSKTGRRKWKDISVVEGILKDELFSLNKTHSSKLKGIGDISSLMSLDEFNKLFKDEIIKPEGAPEVVKNSDKRKALGVDSAKEDFS